MELLDSLTTRLEALMVATESESADALLLGRKGGSHKIRDTSAKLRAAADLLSVTSANHTTRLADVASR